MTDEPKDENDLTDEELLEMWNEGTPVAITSTHPDVEQAPWVHQVDSAPGGVLIANELEVDEPTEDLVRRSA